MKIIILKNKVTFFVFQLLVLFSVFSIDSIDNPIENKFKLNMLLYFSPKEVFKKNEEEFLLRVSYLGNLYEMPVSSHFGGQFILKDWDIQNKYYVVVSDAVELILDDNFCIKGYKVNKNNIEHAKMYIMYLIITTNEKNDMTYNWKIEEIDIPERNLPDNTIIIYSHPKYISFTAFDKKFDKIYPNITSRETSVMILPQATLDFKAIGKEQSMINNSVMDMVAGHKKIIQSSFN